MDGTKTTVCISKIFFAIVWGLFAAVWDYLTVELFFVVMIKDIGPLIHEFRLLEEINIDVEIYYDEL